jgi:hypothetical protein
MNLRKVLTSLRLALRKRVSRFISIVATPVGYLGSEVFNLTHHSPESILLVLPLGAKPVQFIRFLCLFLRVQVEKSLIQPNRVRVRVSPMWILDPPRFYPHLCLNLEHTLEPPLPSFSKLCSRTRTSQSLPLISLSIFYSRSLTLSHHCLSPSESLSLIL